MHTGSPDVAAARFCEALTHIVQLERVSLPDLIELRTAIETTALARAAAAPIGERIEEARAAQAVMDRAEVQPAEFRQADVAFHVALVAASGNRALHLVMLAVKDAIRLHLGEALRSRSFAKVRPRLVEEHRAILKAVERGAGQAAGNQLRQHLGFYAT
jgi:DNA-binding FadR family transcriptional regulator